MTGKKPRLEEPRTASQSSDVVSPLVQADSEKRPTFLTDDFGDNSSALRERLPECPITVVIPTLNEAHQIREAVAVLAWADEVIVVDGGSTDRTPELAAQAGARVLHHLEGTIAGQRNAGIAVARNRWILALDADERVTDALRSELKSLLVAPDHEAYRICFQNSYLGRVLHHGSWGRDWHVRLFTRERRFIERRVHEQLEAVADVGGLRSPILHTPYRDLTHHLEKMIRYARSGAEDLYERGRRANLFDLTVVPAWRFFREYILFSGWLDGSRGLLAAALDAYSGLLRYAYLYARQWQKSDTWEQLPHRQDAIARQSTGMMK